MTCHRRRGCFSLTALAALLLYNTPTSPQVDRTVHAPLVAVSGSNSGESLSVRAIIRLQPIDLSTYATATYQDAAGNSYTSVSNVLTLHTYTPVVTLYVSLDGEGWRQVLTEPAPALGAAAYERIELPSDYARTPRPAGPPH